MDDLTNPFGSKRREVSTHDIENKKIIDSLDKSSKNTIVGETGTYVMGEKIGEGTFSKVKIAYNTSTGMKVAVKIVQKDQIKDVIDMERVCREVRVLKLIQHKHIIRLYEVIDKSTVMYLILEFAGGGELYQALKAVGKYTEAEAERYFRQIISAVEHCHRQNVIHRDLKPENVLLDDAGDVKVVDFGLSNDIVQGNMLKTSCGSPFYASPEMIEGKPYDGPAVDVWSCGIILHALVCGYLPFEDESTTKLFEKITTGTFQCPSHCSPEVVDLIKKMLEKDPANRISITEIWHHPWMLVGTVGLMDDLELDGSGDNEDSLVASPSANADDANVVSREITRTPVVKEVDYELLPPHCISNSYLTTAQREASAEYAAVRIEALTNPFDPKDPPTADVERVVVSGCLHFLPKKEVKEEDKPAASPTIASAKPQARTSRLLSSTASGGGGGVGGGVSPSGSARSSPTASAAKRSSVIAAGGGRTSPTRRPAPAEERPANPLPAMSCAIACKKGPRTLMREIQRAFSEYKVALKSTTPSVVKGEKTRVKFELAIVEATKINDQPVPENTIYLVWSSRLAGDSAMYRDIIRRLLSKVCHHCS